MPSFGRWKPEVSRCGTATRRLVVGNRQGSGADGGTAPGAPAPSQHAQHHTNRGGALFLEHCRRIFSEIEAAEIELSQTHEAPRGTLRVSLPLIGISMMPALAAFMRAYPEIILDLDFSDRVVDVIEEGFAAVVRFAEIGDSRLMSQALGTYRRRLVAAPAYLAGCEGCPSDPGRPQGARVPAPQVSDQRKVRAVAGAVRACLRRDRSAQDSCGKYN
jgi:DNA-binding transcriptional LysR family regulator